MERSTTLLLRRDGPAMARLEVKGTPGKVVCPTNPGSAMLRVYYSNRLERLFDELAAIIAEPLKDPFAPEQIIAQSQGMARWLALGLAERNGIAANIKFVLPAAFVWRSFMQHIPGLTDTAAFDRRVLAWRLMGLLPEWLDEPAFAPLAHYVEGPRPELRRWQLCRQIADVFDQYLIYRPDLLLQWEEGEDEEWQARLWRALASGTDSPHRAGLWREFLHRCEAGALAPSEIPERLIIFGIPTLPPAYLEIVRRMATVTEIHMLVLNPCLLYWGDIEDPHTIARLRKSRKQVKGEDYYTVGNPLLASLGKQGRDFVDLLHELPIEEHEFFVPPGEGTLLGRLQGDILSLADRSRGEAPRALLTPGDKSLQVHSCHSPMREVEVLHDQLLALFNQDESLRPSDVIVMTPNIEDYAPFVEAVFGAARGDRHIPYAIADLSRQSEHPLVQAFLQLLETATGRFTATEVLSLLEVPEVLERFGLTTDDYDNIRRWVAESGIRWGLDGGMRAQWELPEADANSWAFGFRRLFMGYALPPVEEILFQGVLPYPDVEGQSATALGHLRSFIERLARYSDRLRGRYPASDWASLLNELIDTFFLCDSDAAEPLQILRDTAAGLVEETERAGYSGAFSFELLRDFLHGQLAEPSPGQNFLTGRVTFCAMIPMRSVPFRIVCLLGLGDQNFPRTRRPVGFDKIAENPRRGDRSRREDDRYLFLEALLSARDLFYMSYVGRSIRDNSMLLPSVVVTELLDYACAATEGEAARVRSLLVTEHPLQPFSPRYFDNSHPSLFSFAEEWLAGLEARSMGPCEPRTFLPIPLPQLPSDEPVELDSLIRFLKNPAAALLRERLGLRFDSESEVLADTEPFALDNLEAWSLKNELLHASLEGKPLDRREELVAARGILPQGSFGQLCYEAQREAAETVAENVAAHLGSPLPPLEVTLHFEETNLVGWLQHRTADGLLRYRAGKLSATAQLELWIQHLALNAMAPADSQHFSRLFAEDGSLVLRPVSDAAAHLKVLVDLYREGMCTPLPFMPASAWTWVQAFLKEPSSAREKARLRWEGSRFQSGEGSDPYCAIAFRGTDPVDAAFESTAKTVFLPLFEAREQQQ